LLARAVEDVVTPDRLGAASKYMWIITLWLQASSILNWYTTTETLPRITVAEVGAIHFDEDQLLTGVDARWIRRSWSTNKMGIDNNVVPIGREVSGLEFLAL
jgi:hypothetical protein